MHCIWSQKFRAFYNRLRRVGICCTRLEWAGTHCVMLNRVRIVWIVLYILDRVAMDWKRLQCEGEGGSSLDRFARVGQVCALLQTVE